MTQQEVNTRSPRAKLFAQVTAEETEKMAREEAAKRGFDVVRSSNGLFRAMMHVLTSRDLMAEVARRSRERLERIPLWATNHEPKA